MKILITGANGFVGNALIHHLIKSGHEITGLVRNMENLKNPPKHVEWIQGDLLQPQGLPKIGKFDKAFYLVHGLKEQSDRFEYLEAMAAVNFINWIRPSGAGLVYLGGLGPEGNDLSAHLRSRHLTGAILAASGVPTTEFRASVVLEDGSLSFEMIKAICERFPFRPQFKLLSQPCQPIALKDLLKYFEASLEYHPKGHKIFEIGGADVATYGELLDLFSELSKLKRKKVKLPEVETKVLLKLLDYAIPEYSQVGKKLTESLEYPTIVNSQAAREVFPHIHPMGLREAMELARGHSKTHYSALWDKEFLKVLLNDKLLTQSGLLSPDLLRSLERVGKLKDILIKR
jgi:uncharacterized protein YbjT (DUF2867 family)